MDSTMLEKVNELIGGEVYGVWFLVGAALVFFMQCGFAMVETGFTRAKNAGNIIMKNLMDFCIGTIIFILIGFGLLLGENTFFGLIGKPDLQIFTNYADFDWSNFVFNLVFCATTATIVSGAMAERTKFISYCIYSGVLSAVIYPIEAHWIWGGGWLSQLGFHDFAGSCAIHMTGGLAALIGAAVEGARIGKFKRDKNGKVTKVNAIPGHSLTLGALGVFILWFGWYGFNGAAATSVSQLGSIFLTTTIAPATATVVCMIFTWLKYGKPDVSMCLNASLAGLVAITAPCDVTDAAGALVVGTVSGLLVPFGVWFLDHKLHVDDPVGAVAVHFLNGMWGTIAVGLFATGNTPGYSIADGNGEAMKGLFYGGGAKLLGIQLLGMVSVLAWGAVTVTILFLILKHTIGLRASAEEEIIGLDITEHNLPSSYADFMPSIDVIKQTDKQAAKAGIEVNDEVKKMNKVISPVMGGADKNVTPVKVSTDKNTKLTKISVICKQNKLEDLQTALTSIGITGITVTQVLGYGTQKGHETYYRGVKSDAGATLLPKIKVEAIISKVPVNDAVNAIRDALYTGNIGDGKVFVYDVEEVVRVRTGETGYDALQESEE